MPRPNILWLCTDQQRFDTLGCYGNRFVHTPHIDELAKNGVTFDRAFCQSPVCTPSRASMLTGRYPRTTRCYQNGQNIPSDEKLVTKFLADAGYACGLVGKLHISACHPSVSPDMERRIDDGYSIFHWSHHSSPDWSGSSYGQWLGERGAKFETKAFEGSQYVEAGMPAELHQTTWCAKAAGGFIESAARLERPWLCSINFYDPHHPFDPPAEYLKRYLDRLSDIPQPNFVPGELDNKPPAQQIDHAGAYGGQAGFSFDQMTPRDHQLVKAAYWAMCDLIDHAVGDLVQTLKRTGQFDNTLIIFMSDHGEMLGDHGIYLKGPYFYEPAVHVPLILTLSGVITGGRRCNSLVELTDLAPTLMQAAGLKPHVGMQGRSLWPWLTGVQPQPPSRTDVYSEYYDAMPWHRDPPAMATMVRTPTHKLVVFHDHNGDARWRGGELYDLEADPNETTNHWKDSNYAAVKCELLQRLCDRMAGTIDASSPRVANW